MTGPYRDINVRLHRDAFNTPWGFRLQGGKDFKGPLTVQRVFVGSPADGELQRGDVILSIEKHVTSHILHKQAQDIIKAAGGSLELVVRRGHQQRIASGGSLAQSTPTASQQGFRSRPFDTFTPKPDPKIGAFSPTKSPGQAPGISTELGTDYGAGRKLLNKAPSEAMLSRVNQSLNSAIWTNRAEEDDIDYTQRSINDLKNTFSGPTHLDSSYRPLSVTVPHHSAVPSAQTAYSEDDPDYITLSVKELKKLFKKPEHDEIKPGKRDSTRGSRPPHKWRKPPGGYGTVPAGLSEPGWTPANAPTQTEMGWTPARQHVPVRDIPQQSYLETQSRPAPKPVNVRSEPPPPQPDIHHEDPGRPAWAGTLKGSGGPKPWEVHAAAAALSPDEQPRAPHSPRQPAQNAAQGSAFTPHQPRVQNVHYGPGASAPQYQQLSPSQANQSDTARVAHLQYNSPLGLYSRENAEGVLKGQTSGKPGEGTMVITGGGGGKSLDISKSETYRLIHEQEKGGPRSARYIEHQPGQEMRYQGYQDQKKQSPSMQALQQFVSDGPAPSTPQGHAPAAQPQQQAAPQAGGGGAGEENTVL